MKTIIIFLVLYSVLAMAQAYTLPAMVEEKTECHICGKSISRWVEKPDDSYFHNIMPTFFPSHNYHTNTVFEFEFHRKVDLCEECYNKYTTEFYGRMTVEWNDWLTMLKSDNQDKREQYEEQRKQAEKDALKNKIKNLERQIRILNGEEVEEESGILYLDSVYIGGDSLIGHILIADSLINLYQYFKELK